MLSIKSTASYKEIKLWIELFYGYMTSFGPIAIAS